MTRAERISDLTYDLDLSIGPPLSGRLDLSFTLADAGPVSLDGPDGPIAVDARTGPNRLRLDFTGTDDALHRGPDRVHTLFVPDRARRAFPCFDRPDLKGRFRLKLAVPEGWTLLTAPPEAPLSTYLFHFVAGRFETHRAGGLRMLAPPDAGPGRHAPEILRLQAAAVAWMEEYTGVPCPYPADFVLIPELPYRGMEHPGGILYRAGALAWEGPDTLERRLGRASLIAHEVAHLWFGDLVTMRSFDDVWVKEALANFAADKFLGREFPDVDHTLRFVLAHHPPAYAVDRSGGSHAIRGADYGALIYRKTPIVLRQMELRVGPDAFRDGLRRILRTYGHGNASWDEMVGCWEGLEEFARAWIDRAGRPTIVPELAVRDGKIERLTLVQSGGLWPQRLQIAVGERRIDVDVEGPRTEVPGARGLPAGPVLVNSGGLGYGRFAYAGPRPADPLMRAVALEALWEEGCVDIGALATETDELLLARLVEMLVEARPPGLEEALRARIDQPACLKAYRRVVRSEEGRAWLRGRMAGMTEEERLETALALGAPLSESFTDPVLARRFAFVRRAVEEPDAFFASLSKLRRPEPWVLEGLRLLRHVRFLRPALEMIEEVARTGDVFFAEGWATAILADHRSAEAAEVVRDVLPTLPEPLRLKVLQAADPLYRVLRYSMRSDFSASERPVP